MHDDWYNYMLGISDEETDSKSDDVEKAINDIQTRRGQEPGIAPTNCIHEWVTYKGFINIFDYCKKCDIKKEDWLDSLVKKYQRRNK